MNKIKNILLILGFTIIALIVLSCCSIFQNKTYAVTQTVSTDIDGIDESKYPGIKEAIQSLQSSNPNWTFKILYTGLDWNDVISNEYYHTSGISSPRNLVQGTNTKYNNQWICEVCGTSRTFDNGSWHCASEDAIAYMMDPRNSLNTTDIFQFEDLTVYDSSAQTVSTIKAKTDGTFLEGDSVANTILSVAQSNNLNAHFIVARILQEQGSSGSSTTSGKYSGYEGYYNVFNISATGNSSTAIIENALSYAKSQGWDTLEKSIAGGISFLKKQYVDRGQYTLYLQKFDVENSDGTLYTHQYMQNILAAQNEGTTLRKTYSNPTSENHTFVIPVYENMPASKSPRPEASGATSTYTDFGIEYITHIQDVGWETYWNSDSITSGRTGENKKVEAFQIKLVNAPSGVNVSYSTYIDGIGWQSAVSNGNTSGTEGQNKKVYGIKINLENTSDYSVMYRVHVESVGWLNWVSDGELAGLDTLNKKIEAIQIKLIKNNTTTTTPETGTTDGTLADPELEEFSVIYQSHVQSYGWETEWSINGDESGTTGQNKKIEAMRIKLVNAPSENASIQYRFYVEGTGWQNAVSDGEIAGTTGQNKKVYAVRISLENVEGYSIKYRVHVEDEGWLDWVENGEIAGSVIDTNKIESIEIKLEKESVSEPSVQYMSHVQSYGWETEWSTDKEISGTTGNNKKIEAMYMKLSNVPAESTISYSLYVEGTGWITAKDSAMAGTTGNNKKVYGVKILLSNLDGYSVKYRVHVEDEGWLDWVYDGELAGLESLNKKVEAIQVKLIKEGEEMSVEYMTHIQDIGWESTWAKDGETSGTTGQNKKVEAIKVKLVNAPVNTNITYSTYVEGTGWQSSVSNEAESGTTGQNLKLYGIKINLENTSEYSVMYRVHVQSKGWLDWVSDGELAGLDTLDKKIEAIEIKIQEN